MKNRRKFKRLIVVVLLTVSGSALSARFLVNGNSANAQSAAAPSTKVNDPVIRTLIASLQNRENSIRSATGYLFTSTFLNKSSEVMNLAKRDEIALKIQKQENSLSQLYFAADGQKAREDQRQLVPTLNSSYELIAYDGERLQRWRYGSSGSVEKVGGIAEGEEPSQAVSILQLPIGKDAQKYFLSQTLPENNLVFSGKELLNGVETYKVSSANPGAGNNNESWWIAPSKGSLVIKHEVITPASINEVASYRYVTVVDALSEVNKVWVPMSVRSIVYATLKGTPNTEVWTLLTQTQIGSIQVNEDVPKGTFSLPLPLGTKVAKDGQLAYIIGGDTSEFEAQLGKGPSTVMIEDNPMSSPNLEAKAK